MKDSKIKPGDLYKMENILFHVISINPWKAEWLNMDLSYRDYTTISLEVCEHYIQETTFEYYGDMSKSNDYKTFYDRICK